MKRINYIILTAILILVAGCGEDFLDTKDLYHKSDESYYRTPADIEEALAGAYAAVPINEGNNNPFIVAELLSDDCFGGGGTNDDGFHATDAYIYPPNDDYYMNLFESSWKGILRVNTIINRFDQAEYLDMDARGQALGEAHFLRAYFYFRLSKFFGPVPLKLEPAPSNLPRATPEEMYSQIALDLKIAIENMPSTPFSSISIDRLGHVNKWAAEAMMARVYLFYTGLYLNDIDAGMPLADGSTLTKNQVIEWLDECVNSSGYGLLSDFRNNWDYTKVDKYSYCANNNLTWADGDQGLFVGGVLVNKETVWGIKYSPFAGWSPPDQQMSYSNQHSLYVGLRQQSYIPFGQGWGSGTVNPQLWNSFEEGDLRREGSILNVQESNADEGTIPDDFIWGSDNQNDETGYWQKKYMPTYDSIDARIAGIYFIQYGSPDDFQLWNMQDDVLIRFADVLLMGAELGSSHADEYFNAVRERAGLDPVSATLDNIKRERRHELAFEGLRHFDLMRWHDIDAAHALVVNIPVQVIGEDAIYDDTYRPETGGFIPIPLTEVILSEGVLEQTPGW